MESLFSQRHLYRRGGDQGRHCKIIIWPLHSIQDEINKILQLKIEDVSVLGADEQGLAEDVISDPEEDTLAGQMALMKGAAVKKVANDDSDEESSTDDDKESDSDSDSD